MYDNRRMRYLPPQPEIDIYQIIREAQTRWLRPVEVIEILRNYQKFRLNPVPPNKPPSGSLFLFDRKTLRFFRKDGHNWRKKKDGKTVREAHERLKAGSVDVLHCYYAHGEDNPNFQRRSYWMLEGAYEHIVLVHYREVTEGSRSSVYRSIQEAKENASQSSRPTGLGVTANSPGLSDPEVTGPYKSPEVVTTPLESEGTDSADEQDDADAPPAVDIPQSSLLQQVSGTLAADIQHLVQPPSFTFKQSEQKPQLPSQPQPLNLSAVDFDDLLRNPDAYLNSSKPMSAHVTLDVGDWNAMLENFRGTPSKVGVQDHKPSLVAANPITSDAFNGHTLSATQTLQSFKAELQHMEVDGRQVSASQGGAISCQQLPAEVDCYKVANAPLQKQESSMLKKLDSFGRWMSREIGEDSQSSLLSGSSDHGPGYWTLADATLDEISSFSHEMQLDGGPGPSVPQDQHFTIGDFSPDWAFSSEETKVIVAGNFLKAAPTATWHCMFGEVEVPAEIIYEGALRCKAPRHAAGRVPFYITRGNRLACSEIREFEYRVPSGNKDTAASDVSQMKIEQLQMRFAKHVSLCADQNDPGSYSCEQAQLNKIQALTSNLSKQWADIEKHAEDSSWKEQVLEALLKQQLQKWLLCKLSSADGKGASLLDERGQCVLHLAAALGYDWALPAILAAGVGINFRDSHGWTALHWAAAYGRENVVSTLLAAGASPGLVTDPTPQYPAGRTPADLAASSGHKGMAGYLAELSLTSHLTALTVKENASEIDTFSAVLAEEKAVELIAEEGQTAEGLQGSLRAVRNAARAAALIHASFRQDSFKRRQEKEGLEIVDDYQMSLNEIKAMTSRQGRQRNERLNLAATKIQQKFRGWKGRKDFLLFRRRVVRIQAHVRGQLVRRKFRKLLWTVGIVEKAVLRWRRKRAGLRNFRAAAAANTQVENSDEDDEVLRAGRKQKEAAIQKAVTRVQSMVRSPEAREQYQRLQDAVKHAAAGDARNDGDEMSG